MEHKKKLTIDEQIEFMKNSGITFNYITESDAKEYLTSHTYFFKIKSYAKNYDKNNAGKYTNLDFYHLQQLAIIDLNFRKLVLIICLELEHYLKVDLNKHFSYNTKEDGYSIIDEFFKSDFFSRNKNQNKIQDKIPSHYNEDLINKYRGDYAIWNYIEIISFGEFIALYKFYFDKYDSEKTKLYPLLFSIKHLRNACAHNNCILNNIRKSINRNLFVHNFLLREIKMSSNIVSRKTNKVVPSDFSSLLICYKLIVTSSNSKERINKEMSGFLNLIQNQKKTFKNNDEILSLLNFFEQLIKFFVGSN